MAQDTAIEDFFYSQVENSPRLILLTETQGSSHTKYHFGSSNMEDMSKFSWKTLRINDKEYDNYYSPFNLALTQDRKNCMAAIWCFNNATNPSHGDHGLPSHTRTNDEL